MKFGACCGVDKLPALKAEGYDYIEGCFSNLALMEETDFAKMYNEIEHYGIPAESYNGFFKPDIKLNGDVDYKFIAEYAEKGFSRAERLGGKIAVLGSGGARKIPDGYDRRLATTQFARVLNICGDIAGRHGMRIAIEPLRRGETNFINTVEDGIEMCRIADNENVKCLADFFHVYMNDEALDAIENSGDMIIHTHIARPNADRNIPTVADIDVCTKWAKALKKCGYNGRMSLEGGFKPDFETAIHDVKPILDLFRG